MVSFQRLIEGEEPARGDPFGRRNDYSVTARRPHVGSFAPSVEDAPATLRARIDALAASGALDEGSGSFFDRMIASWVEQWHNDVDREHEARQSELHLEEARIRAKLAQHLEAELAAKRRMAELDTEIAGLRAAPPRRSRTSRKWRWRLRDNDD
jgi:hypothetical protein